MLAKVHAAAVVGLEGAIVEVEVDTGRGLPSFIIVGLPDAAVQEMAATTKVALTNRRRGEASRIILLHPPTQDRYKDDGWCEPATLSTGFARQAPVGAGAGPVYASGWGAGPFACRTLRTPCGWTGSVECTERVLPSRVEQCRSCFC